MHLSSTEAVIAAAVASAATAGLHGSSPSPSSLAGSSFQIIADNASSQVDSLGLLAAENVNEDFYDGILSDGEFECHYEGTDYLEVKILLIGVFASGTALLSFMLNAFLVLVFAQSPKLRRSPLYYFGVLALLDLALALLYLALMSVPVYMDQFRLLWLYHLFLLYLRPMLTLSNFAMFASVLMILLATTERLLLTFSGKKVNKARRLLERHRPHLTVLVMAVAGAYKLCTYFEIEVDKHENCTGFEEYEVVSAVHGQSLNPMFTLFGPGAYRFWWMFVIRNLVDHIVPFFLLVILNFYIVRALHRERLRATQHLADVLCSAAPPLVSMKEPHRSREGSCGEKSQRRGSVRSLRESIRNKVRLRKRLQKVSGGTAEDHAQKKNLRAATRALVSVISMYLMSKVLQVAVTFFETFADAETIREANTGKFRPHYSYVNDAISILTLLSSALRFPVYCACNKPMLTASKVTLRRLLHGPGSSNLDPKSNGGDSREEWRRRSREKNGPPLLPRSRQPSASGTKAAEEWAQPNGRAALAFSSAERSPPGKRRVLRLLNGKLVDKQDNNGNAGPIPWPTPRMASPEEEEVEEDEEEEETAAEEELFC